MDTVVFDYSNCRSYPGFSGACGLGSFDSESVVLHFPGSLHMVALAELFVMNITTLNAAMMAESGGMSFVLPEELEHAVSCPARIVVAYLNYLY